MAGEVATLDKGNAYIDVDLFIIKPVVAGVVSAVAADCVAINTSTRLSIEVDGKGRESLRLENKDDILSRKNRKARVYGRKAILGMDSLSKKLRGIITGYTYVPTGKALTEGTGVLPDAYFQVEAYIPSHEARGTTVAWEKVTLPLCQVDEVPGFEVKDGDWMGVEFAVYTEADIVFADASALPTYLTS